jgi:hypothetical protein
MKFRLEIDLTILEMYYNQPEKIAECLERTAKKVRLGVTNYSVTTNEGTKVGAYGIER